MGNTTILSGYPQVIPSLWTTRLPIFAALSSYETIKNNTRKLTKIVIPLCYAEGIPTTKGTLMFTLHNPMKVMNERYVVTSHPCPTCGEEKTVSISSAELFAYHQGGLAQTVLSAYDADVRERFITGICGGCWNEMFGDEE